MVLFIGLVLAGTGDEAYLAGLEAWQGSDWEGALARAREAQGLEPDHRAAALLEGYALMRLHQKDEGSARLRQLSELPADDSTEREVQRRAERAWRRYAERFARELVQLDGYAQSGPQFSYGATRLRGGWGAALTVALPGPVEARVGVSAPLPDFGLFEISGARFDLCAVTRLPVGRGVWTADLALGPTLWNATGNYWPEGSHRYTGLRASAGLDVRPAWRFGFRGELGGQYYFGAADLPHTLPFDVRLGLTTWLGGKR